MGSKLSPQQAGKKKSHAATQIREKLIFLLFGLQLENKERYRDGSNGWNDAYIQGNKCPVDKKWLRGRFDSVLPAQSWEMPVEREIIFFVYIKKILSGGFCSTIKIVAG